MTDERWYEISLPEAVIVTVWLVASFYLFGLPTGWDWLVLPIALLAGLWFWKAAIPWLWHRLTDNQRGV